MRKIFGLTLLSVATFMAMAQAEAGSPYCRKGRYCPPVMPAGVRPPDVRVEILGLRGTGCPAGTARATVSPDATTLSVLFDTFMSEIPATPSPISDSKNCSIELGFRFYGQYRLAMIGSDVRGFFSVPAGARSKVSVLHNSIFLNFSERDKMNFTKEIIGPAEGTLDIQSRFPDMALWSYCGTQSGNGAQRVMSIDLSIESQNQNPEGDLLVGVDSLDLNANPSLKYHMVWAYDTKNCPR